MRFAEMLDRKAEDITPPPLLPAGSYVLSVKGHEIADVTGGDGTVYDVVNFNLVVVAPDEVDEDALAEYGNVVGAPLRHNFMFNTDEDETAKRESTLNRLKIFLEALGVFPEGTELGEGLANSTNARCIGIVGHRPDKNDKERFYTEVKKVLPLE